MARYLCVAEKHNWHNKPGEDSYIKTISQEEYDSKFNVRAFLKTHMDGGSSNKIIIVLRYLKNPK